MNQQPVLVGLKVCKDVIVDKKTGNVTLVNCFHKLRVQKTPTPGQDYTICCVHADGVGEMTLTLKVSDLQTAKTVLMRSWPIRLARSLDERWLYVGLKRFVFPRAGRFEFLLLIDGEWFAQSTVTVLTEGEKS
jgi:hypothetical protein